MKLQGQTILITGGSSGIGLELARYCLARNNTVIICGRSQEKLDQAKKLLPAVNTFRCDVSSQQERLALFDYLQAHHPALNVLINNAAIVHKTNFHTDDDIPAKAEAEVDTNLMAPIALSKIFLSTSLHPTAIINITTGLIYAPRAVYPIYNATKAALHSFTQVLRYQMKDAPINIVEVMMPVVDTAWHQGAAPKIAISPKKAVSKMMADVEGGKQEINVGAVKMLRMLSRLSPSLAFRMINRIR